MRVFTGLIAIFLALPLLAAPVPDQGSIHLEFTELSLTGAELKAGREANIMATVMVGTSDGKALFPLGQFIFLGSDRSAGEGRNAAVEVSLADIAEGIESLGGSPELIANYRIFVFVAADTREFDRAAAVLPLAEIIDSKQRRSFATEPVQGRLQKKNSVRLQAKGLVWKAV